MCACMSVCLSCQVVLVCQDVDKFAVVCILKSEAHSPRRTAIRVAVKCRLKVATNGWCYFSDIYVCLQGVRVGRESRLVSARIERFQ